MRLIPVELVCLSRPWFKGRCFDQTLYIPLQARSAIGGFTKEEAPEVFGADLKQYETIMTDGGVELPDLRQDEQYRLVLIRVRGQIHARRLHKDVDYYYQ